MQESKPLHILCCYARQDRAFRDNLDKHLSAFKQQRLPITWSDREVSLGAKWKIEIDNHLRDIHLVLCLVSPDFLNADYPDGPEMNLIFGQHKKRMLHIIPILVRPTYWKTTRLAPLQMLPSDLNAVDSWPNSDAAWVNVVEGINVVIQEIIVSLQAQENQGSFPQGATSPKSTLLSQGTTINKSNSLLSRFRRTKPGNLNAKSYTIAIIGNVFSGKSHYIASCIYKLTQGYAARIIGCNFIRGLGDTDERYYDNYYEPLYLQRHKFNPTPAASSTNLYEPLIYELEFANRPPINLLFYDVSGEDIRDPMRMVQYCHFIFDASAIIFLADPMQMPKIVQTLPSHLKPYPAEIQKLADVMVLDRVMTTFKRTHRIKAGQKIKIPIAITVSKSDLLTFAASDEVAARYLYDNTYTNQLDTVEFDQISWQVQELLSRFGDGRLLQITKSFQTVSFFAVTSTGWSSDANGEYPSIEPRRCFDPLLWELWKLGIINPEK